MIRRRWLLTLLPLSLAVRSGVAAATLPLHAVASFSVLADMVQVVGGQRVEVTSLIGRGGDPHAYEPTPDDARRLKGADLVFVNGLGLEGFMSRLVGAAGYRGQVVVVSGGVKPRSLVEDGATVTDPHAWNDPANGILYVRAIERALTAADPGGAALYQANADAYVKALQAVDADARARIGAIPVAQRKVLTSHDALGYLGQAYGVTFLAPLGLSTESEASAKDVAALIRQIRSLGIRHYFFGKLQRSPARQAGRTGDRRHIRGRALCRIIVARRGTGSDLPGDDAIQYRQAHHRDEGEPLSRCPLRALADGR